MVTCRRCGKECASVGGLRKHQVSNKCRGSSRKRGYSATVTESEKNRQPFQERVPLPPRLGGSGRSRPADGLLAAQPNYWQEQAALAISAAEERARCIDVTAQAQASAGAWNQGQLVFEGGAPEVGASGGDSVPHVALRDVEDEDEEEEEEYRGAENATGPEIRDAILLLARQLSERAGARMVDRFLRILTHKQLPEAAQMLESQGLDTVASITKELDCEVLDSMKERGFGEVWVANPDKSEEGISIFVRDPVAVIERQLRKARVTGPHGRNFYFKPLRSKSKVSGEDMIAHPMSGDLANTIVDEVISEIMGSTDPGVTWDERKSFMCMLQVYSDKSHMSLSTKAHVFYPLHIAVLNLDSELKDATVRSGETVVAYLSTSSKWKPIPVGAKVWQARPLRRAEQGVPEAFMDTTNPDEKSQINKVLFRCSLAAILRPVRDAALPGLEFKDADETPRRAHLVLAAYTADTPEMHLLTCTKQGCCPKCEIASSQLFEPGTVKTMRSCRKTKQHLQRVYQMVGPAQTEARNEMWKLHGLSTAEPALLGWPFSSIPGLDMYSIVRFDMLHCGPLGLLKHIVNAVWERSKSQDLRTAFHLDGSKKPKTFSSVSGSILRACNEYLQDVDRNSPAVGFSVNFTRGKKDTELDGLFTDSGIASMLQGKDYRMVQEILPFIGVLIDRYYGKGYAEGESVPIHQPAYHGLTTAFVLYQKMDQAMRRKDMEDVGFTREGIVELENAIKKFQNHVLRVLGGYQKSGFSIEKWHAFNHVAEDISALGLPSGFDTAVFDASHKTYKDVHRATSRRHGSAVKDATNILARNESTKAAMREQLETSSSARIVHELVNGAPRRSAKVPRSLHEAVHEDLAVLPANGLSFNWKQLSTLVAKSFNTAEGLSALLSEHDSGVTRGMREFIEQLRDPDFVHKAMKVIHQKVFGGDAELSESEHVKGLLEHEKKTLERSICVTVLKSARIAGHPAPSLHHLRERGRVALHGGGSGFRIAQRVISSASFSHGKRMFQDCVMIDGNSAPESGEDQAPDGNHGEPDPMGVTRSPRACEDEGEPYSWTVWFAKALSFIRVRASQGPMSIGQGEEFVIVRYFQVMCRSELDAVDKATECIKLKWACDPCCGKDEEQEPWIDVVPAASMRGRIHVVEEPNPRGVGSGSKKWTEQAFYVNKFKLSNYDPTYHTRDRQHESFVI